MKTLKCLFVVLLLSVFGTEAFAQPSYGGQPISFSNKGISTEIDHVKISPPDMQFVVKDADVFEKNGQIYKIAEMLNTDLNMENSGTWDYLDDGTKIWRLKISVEGAKGLALYYKEFYLPEHTKLFLYNENRKQVIGAFDYRNNPTMFKDFSTEIIQGKTVYLELTQKPEATENPNIQIFQIAYVYRGVEQLVGRYENEKITGGVGSSDVCEVNVNCPEGANWQMEKRGIAEVFVVEGASAGWCSGTLVSNTSFDGTPYFLTADHCGGGTCTADDFAQWQFYFNYEAAGCADPSSEPSYSTITGAVKRARGDMDNGSDYLLVELNCTEEQLNLFGAYYNGWNRGVTPSSSGVIIHHPSGDIKKISTYTSPVTEGTYNACPANVHWKAKWVQTVTNWGVTEGGSSGAPLFDNNKLVVGTLSGGSSYCGALVNSSYDLFGKFDYHWISNGETADLQLKPWLDPINSGSITCPGYYAGSSTIAVQGSVYNDLNQNCSIDSYENGISGQTLLINPGNIIVQTNTFGVYSLDSLDEGIYTITIDTTNLNWIVTCPVTQSFDVLDSELVTFAPSFGMKSTEPCSDPDVSIYAPILRRCFENQTVHVQAMNNGLATGAIEDAYTKVQFHDLISLQSSDRPYTFLGDNTYQFDLGDILPGQNVYWRIYINVSCDAVLDQTLCMQAELFPIQDCSLDSDPSFPGGATGDIPPCTTPWDHSSLSVEGWCQNDSVYFSVRNTGEFGEGDMQCLSPVRIYIDGVLESVQSIQLDGGQTMIYGFEATGQTWRLEADQHPLHPGNSYPNAVVELCGENGNWTPGLVDAQYLDDADPIKDIYCGTIVGSYDPNDKSASPFGVGPEGYVSPNQSFQYYIRFQNTGNDTAFTVVIRDTLDLNLNIFSVTSGVSSHPYTFQIAGSRVLEWRFDNILLVDSTTNEPDSHGFVSFTVNQNPDLPYGTQILNKAGIYFDYNDPVITNEVVRTLYDFNPLLLGNQTGIITHEMMTVYPNPSASVIFIEFSELKNNAEIKLINILGETVYSDDLKAGINYYKMSVGAFSRGLYFIELCSERQISKSKLIIY